MQKKYLKAALLGFGTVGASVARILTEREDLADQIRLTHIFNRNIQRKRVGWVKESVIWTDDIDSVFASKPDVIIELIGGINPAEDWVRRALTQGTSVVTANKTLLADKGPNLFRLATECNAQLLFEAAVGGGIPVIRGIHEGLIGDRITGVVGILNGTCNYILSRMATTREPMDAVLAEAQRLGFAESDPSADLDGNDAVAKIVLLAGVAFQKYTQRTFVGCQSIRRVTTVDFDYAHELGCTIRQLSFVKKQQDSIWASVGPTLVSLDSDFGRNDGANNLITTIGKYGGKINFSGAGAGGNPTSVSVVSDLLALVRHNHNNLEKEWIQCQPVPPLPQQYYLRFIVKDKPGIVAAVASALSGENINLDSVVQLPGYPKNRLPFVVTLENCEKSALQAAMNNINKEDFHVEAPLVLPIENDTRDNTRGNL